MRIARLLIALSLTPVAFGVVAAQGTTQPLTEAQQIALAVLPLPGAVAANACLLGYRSGSAKLVTLREGTGPFICLASDPASKQFHVACYHRSLEPFMARGRQLRDQGVTGEKVDTVRFAEIKSGKLGMQSKPPQCISSRVRPGASTPRRAPRMARARCTCVYISGATEASTGLSAQPGRAAPGSCIRAHPRRTS